jgi:hypothetical protein
MTPTRTLILSAALACFAACSSNPPDAPASAPAPRPSGTPATTTTTTTTTTPPAPAVPQPTASAAAPAAELGKPAPAFTLSGADGKTYSLADFKGKTLVLEWFNPDCPFVRHAHTDGPLATLAKKVMSPSVAWVSINSGAPGKQGHGLERNVAAKTEYAIDNPILLDETGKVGHAYGALKTPHLFIVDPQGVLVYRGGLDNAPIGKVDPARPVLPTSKAGEVVSYVNAALEDLAAARAVRLADTPPYGCTVKYQS